MSHAQAYMLARTHFARREAKGWCRQNGHTYLVNGKVCLYCGAKR
jgi:hypothetical protein